MGDNQAARVEVHKLTVYICLKLLKVSVVVCGAFLFVCLFF